MKYWVLLIIISISVSSYSQEKEDIITDRPDETESATLISKGFFQIESGFFYEEIGEDHGKEKIWAYNSSLLRYGLLENLELRVGFDIIRKKDNLEDVLFDQGTGLHPFFIGAKIGITEEKGPLPQMALMGHLHLPFTLGADYQQESSGIDFRFAFAHQFTNSNLSYNLGAKWLDDDTYATFIYTVAYGYDLTEKFGVFLELYGDLPENYGPSHHWDGGITYLVSNNFQLDAFIGSGINNDQRIIYGGGISFRFPN